MLVNPIELFSRAKKEGYAIGAFNTSDLNITKAIIEAAEELRSPVIIETSEGEIDFLSPEISGIQVRTLAKKAKIPVVLHLDHGKKFETVVSAIKNGYTSIHLDGSANDYRINRDLTKNAVEYAHKKGVSVEGEIGHITGGSEKHEKKIEISPDTLTDPDEAKDFVDATGIDVLAVAIGNIHGMYSNPPTLDFERLEKIVKRLNCYFSLHGGSGIPKNQIQRAIKMGITKVNVNTELRLAFKEGLLHEFDVHPEEVIPYKYLPAGTEAVKKVVEGKIKLFGSTGKV
jgi:fructose-bisphosphate aldolase class II